jgi:tetratricopeptide (TPR) repeat protein/glycosyltransferase involved in cell wall biosynthesis
LTSRPTPSSAAADQLFQQNQFGQADEAYAALLQAESTHEWAALQHARCAVHMGEGRLARDRFAALLKAHPDNFSAWLEAGHLCRQQSAFEQALASYQRAMVITPTRYEAPLGAARLLEDMGRREEGAALYHRASTLVPADKRYFMHQRMAKFRQERGDTSAALDSLRQALLCADALTPALPLNERCELLIDLGELLLRINAREDAMPVLTQASQATAEATLVRLAETSFRFNLWQESQAVLQRNAELHPTSAAALWNLAHGYVETWEMDLAIATLERAEAIAPQPGAASLRASVAGRLGDADTALAAYAEIAEKEGPLSKMRSSTAMASLYSDQLSPKAVATLHRELFAPMGEGARSRESFANPRDANKCLRLGLVTADFHHQHPVNIFMQPVLARWDAQDIEVTVYFTGVSYDEQTLLAKRRVSHWVEVTTLNNVQLARRIEEDGIDVLMDLAGHTGMQRMPLFAQRAAPVQATFLGYPGSTGVPQMDWIVADSVVAPEGSEALFSEEVMRLPNTVFCYAPEENYPFPTFSDEHAKRPLTFASFNNVSKLTPRSLALWAQVLQAVPNSRLMLKAPSFKDEAAVKVFVQRFKQLGVALDRLEFRGPSSLSDMMAEYADVDIALDPAPYNGGTTSLQAMWMGVPVLTIEGGHFVSRMGASFMQAAGLPEWVAKDDADFVRRAVALSQDRAALLKLKMGMRERLLALSAWDIDAYAQDLQAAVRKMWIASSLRSSQ